jgi:hypothetical protein
VVPPDDPSGYVNGDSKWIGLLSCSTGSNLEFVGIPLVSMGRNNETSAQVTCFEVHTDASFCNTLVVGSRAAARSVLETVTIIGFDESQDVRGYNWGYRQIVVQESKSLQEIGYQVKNGTGWNIAEPKGRVYGYNPIWDTETRTLSIEGIDMFRDIIELCLEPSWSGHNTKFTIFMRTVNSRAIVRAGDGYSEDDKRNFYDYLEHPTSQNESGNIVIPDSAVNLFQVSVGVHATRVYEHRLFEVNVDAVKVVAGNV